MRSSTLYLLVVLSSFALLSSLAEAGLSRTYQNCEVLDIANELLNEGQGQDLSSPSHFCIISYVLFPRPKVPSLSWRISPFFFSFWFSFLSFYFRIKSECLSESPVAWQDTAASASAMTVPWRTHRLASLTLGLYHFSSSAFPFEIVLQFFPTLSLHSSLKATFLFLS